MAAIVRKLSDRVKSSATAALIRHASSRSSAGRNTPPATSTDSISSDYAPPAISMGSNASSNTPPATSSSMNLNIKEPNLPLRLQHKLKPVIRSENTCTNEAKECYASLGKCLGSCFHKIKMFVIIAVIVGWFPLLVAGLVSKGVLENIDKENMKSAGNATQIAADGSGSGSQMRWPMVMIIVAGSVGGLVLLGGGALLPPSLKAILSPRSCVFELLLQDFARPFGFGITPDTILEFCLGNC